MPPTMPSESSPPHYRLGTVLLFGSWGSIFSGPSPGCEPLHPHRRDGPGPGHPIHDLNYSPREGEVRTYLTDWANYRYTISRDTIAKKYPLNYYFLSQALASQLMAGQPESPCLSGCRRPDRAE